MGVTSKVTQNEEEGVRLLPANDGTGECKGFQCRAMYRLLISSSMLYQLSELGFKCSRLQWEVRLPQRNAEQFIRVTEVLDEGRYDETFCFTETGRGMGMFNGILTGQCSEITLMTSAKRTAVCCLSSLNLEKYDEWKDTTLVADLLRFLDNVLEYFIRLAPKTLERAVRSAKKERAIGIGTLGWHGYLQKNNIPFESGGLNSAAQLTHTIYKDIKSKAAEASQAMASYRGEAPDTEGSGYRNSHFMAIAPNASSSSLVGASPSVEPFAAVAYVAQGRAGSFLIKNKYFREVLQTYGEDTRENWDSIISNEGSVQHLTFLTDHEKLVFKTAREINPQMIIELAAIRQKHVCQSQSINLFVKKDITLQEMSDLHMLAWKKGLKSLYYCRAEAAGKVEVGTGGDKPLNSIPVKQEIAYEECLSCHG
jgi:ribonucleoside-diphosphate reductase alpha chain